MTNYDIIKVVNLAINKDVNGNAFSPDEYKTMINSASLRLFMEKLGLTQEYNGTPVSRQGVSISKANTMSLLPFQTVETITLTSGNLVLTGKNIAYIGAIMPSTMLGRGIDEVEPYELADRLGDPVVVPTDKDPIMVWRTPTAATIYPSTITSVTAYYYTYPIPCDFTLTPNPATLLPDYTSITELQWNDIDKIEIAYRIIREAGVNIERGDVVGYADKVIQTGK